MVKIIIEFDNVKYEESIEASDVGEVSLCINGRTHTVLSRPDVMDKIKRRKERIRPLIEDK